MFLLVGPFCLCVCRLPVLHESSDWQLMAVTSNQHTEACKVLLFMGQQWLSSKRSELVTGLNLGGTKSIIWHLVPV